MRVVVSLTTIPGREKSLAATLASLRAQTFPASEIRVHVDPFEYVGHASAALAARERDSIRFVQDRGPLTKLAAVLDPELAGDTIIVTVDDDIVYEPHWLEVLVFEATKGQGEAVGMSGWNVRRMLSSSHGGFEFVRPPATCDVLEGWAGAAYRRGWFDADVLDAPDEFRCCDDVWISSYLAKRGIARRVCRTPMAREYDRAQLGLHNRPDFRELNRRAVHLAFGSPRT